MHHRGSQNFTEFELSKKFYAARIVMSTNSLSLREEQLTSLLVESLKVSKKNSPILCDSLLYTCVPGILLVDVCQNYDMFGLRLQNDSCNDRFEKNVCKHALFLF